MDVPNKPKDIEFRGPATYRIVVQGELEGAEGDRLAGLAVTVDRDASASPRSVLFGCIRDQSELSGVLDALYGMHLPILSVERVDDEL